MSSKDFGAVVVRRGVDSRVPWQVGDDVTTYLLEEPLPVAVGRHSGCDEALARYMAGVEAQIKAQVPDLWREDSALYCTCPSRRKIASVLVHRESARLWVSPRPERPPRNYRDRDSGFSGQVEAWPMHGAPGEAAHVGDVTTCNGCKQAWLVLSTHDSAYLVAVRPHYGAHIAP